MSRQRITLGVGIAAAVGAAVFLGWRLLGFIEDMWGPDANPFAPRPVIAAARPVAQVAEVVPPEGVVTLRDTTAAMEPGDVPGWRMRAGAGTAADADGNDPAGGGPWRGADTPVWRQPLGGQGTSSPIVVGERIVCTIADAGPTLWTAGGISVTAGATPVVVDDICVATTGFPTRAMVALRMPPAGGPATVLWKEDRDSEIPYVPSPLVHAGRLYVVHDDGLAHCRDLATGRVAWKQRVGGGFSASPVIVNGELLCTDESGRCTLLGLADGTVKHRFALPGGCFATPVVSRGRLLIRTTEELVAFDVAVPPAAAE